MDDLVGRARDYAVGAHQRIHHRRKYTGQPYDAHLAAVASLVASVTDEPATIAAAWLHDVVEDTPATFEEVERLFGPAVASLVRDLTDVSRPWDGNRAERKARDREHLASSSPRAKTVKLADLVDNCDDICRHDPAFGRVFVREMALLLGVLTEGDPALLELARKTAARWAEELRVDLGALPSPAPAGHAHPPPGVPGRADQGKRGYRLFVSAFTARDVLGPLPSLDGETLRTAGLRGAGLPAGWSVAGVRRGGRVEGYVLPGDGEGGEEPAVRPIDPAQAVDVDASLPDVIHVLSLFSCCFVTLEGDVAGVVTRRDVEKPVVRMWLFGIIILIEMMAVRTARERWPGESWLPLVGEGRLARARELRAERERRGLPADLLDCLQFSDKLQLVLNDPAFLEGAGFPSVRAAKRAAKELESLRNHIAHGQEIAGHDWPPIVRLAVRAQALFSAGG